MDRPERIISTLAELKPLLDDGCWTYMVFRKLYTSVDYTEYTYTIREVYEMGEYGIAWSSDPEYPMASFTPEDLRFSDYKTWQEQFHENLKWMQQAVDSGIIIDEDAMNKDLEDNPPVVKNPCEGPFYTWEEVFGKDADDEDSKE
jgi:hypothetical protein